MKSVLATSLVLASLSAAWVGTATAATPFQLTEIGGDPQVAVDGAGTGHFAWNEGKRGEPDVTHYCQVPRGGMGCTVSRTFIPAGNSPTNNVDFDGPKVFVIGGAVTVMTKRCCGGFPPGRGEAVIIYTSTDSGTTFGPQQVVGDANIAGDAIVGPGGRLSTISDVVTGGTFYQAHTPGTYNELDANLGDGPSQSYSGSLALIDANTPIATFDDLDTTFWRRYTGTGDPNDVANWTPTTAVGPGEEGRLAFGPNGVWLLYLTGTPGDRTYVARQFTGGGFGAPIAVTETGGPIFADFFQDPAGRHHAVWLDGPRALVYRRSDVDGMTYGPVTELDGATFNHFNLEVAAGADGEGWAVWDSNSNTGVVGAAALEVAQEPPPAPALGRTVTVRVVRGEVRIKLPPGASASQKGADFEPLTEARTIPVRSILDTRKGTIALRAARNRAGRIQSGRFSAGVFQVLQSRKRRAKGLTTLKLKGSRTAFRRCDSSRPATAEAARLSRRAIRRLRARARGRYRTRGRRSAATVRGTVWNTTDSCAGTLTRVKRGKVAVRDFRRKRTIVLKRGQKYLARAPQ